MSSIDELKIRIDYRGGPNQQARMIQDKLQSLRKALIHSYQAGTVRLSDGREFRALLNPDKNKFNYDDMVLSIPFEDICLNQERVGKTREGYQKIGLRPGDTFTWIPPVKDINDMPETHWLIYLWQRDEVAYFRGSVRMAETAVEINGQRYWAWFKGPEEEAIEWGQKKNVEWNNLNYSRVMFITKDDNTLHFFRRFAQLYEDEDGALIANPKKTAVPKRWEVEAVNAFYGEGMIKVALSEYFGQSTPEDDEDKENNFLYEDEEYHPIAGPEKIRPYDTVLYTVTSPIEDTQFEIINGKQLQILVNDNTHLKIYNELNKHGRFQIKYGPYVKDVEVTTI